MALQYNLIPLRDLARGVDFRSAESNIADGFSEDLINVVCNSSGQLSKRPGYEGYAGYVPFRVKEIEHDGFQIVFKLGDDVNLSSIPASPILVYGKLPSAQSGDFSTTNVLKSYATYSLGVRNVFTPTANTTTRSAASDGLSSDDLFVHTLTSTSESNNSNSWALPEDVSVTTAFDLTVTYTPAAPENVFVAIVDKAATAGTSYIEDYSGTPLSPTAGVCTDTITASTHGLGNFNIIPKVYTLSGSTYSEVIPDSLAVAENGDVTFSVTTGAADFDGKVILAVTDAEKYAQQSVGAATTETIVISDLETDFPYWALYRVNGTDLELTLPDSAVVDTTTGELTITITNASASIETYEVYYDFASIAANKIRVVDLSATSATYTETSPQLTVWGISHVGSHEEDGGGKVNHIDAYKRESESRLVCGLAGNLYASRTRSEVGTTYQMPTLSVDLDARVASSVNMAPLFAVTGSSVARTRGLITGDNVADGYAVVTGVSYVSDGVCDYTISLTNKTGTVVFGTHVDGFDKLTVSGMAHDIYNGSYRILSVTSQSANDLVLRVTNALASSSDQDETGAAGKANVFTDVFTTTVATNHLVDDGISSDAIDSGLSLTVVGVDGTSVYVSGVTEQVTLAAGINLFGERTGYVHPLKNTANAAAVKYLVKGDMVDVLGLTRHPRVTMLNPYHDMACTIVVASGTATLTVGTSKTISSIDTGTEVFTSVAHGLIDNDPVRFSTTSSLPTGMRADVVYYVDKVTDDTFKVLSDEDGTTINLASSGSGTITVSRVHALSQGQRFTLTQTGDFDLDGVWSIDTIPSVSTLTFDTDAADGSYTGVLVGRTAEFDESLTFSDNVSLPTTVTVNTRWVPIESPTVTGNLPEATYRTYFDDDSTILRSGIVAGSMFFTNQLDEIVKFDGTSIYQAGLFRWQPQLFAQIDTGTASLVLEGNTATVSVVLDNKFTVDLGDQLQYKSGQRIVHSQNSAIYTVDETGDDSANGFVYVTTAISGSSSGTLKKVKTYKYYFRLNAIDANNNVIASAATGAEDFKIELAASGQIRMRLLSPPVFGNYDYDRIELNTYRTIGDTSGPYYLIRVTPVTFSAGYNYIDVYDGTPDAVLEERSILGDDLTMIGLLGKELGTAWEQPLRAKYLTSVNNRLILGNVKDYQQLDIVLRTQSGAASTTASNLSGQKFTFRKDSADTSTTTNMVDRVVYEYVNSGAVTIDPATDIARNATTFTITEAGHGLVVGDWVYLFHAAAGTNNDLHFAGWHQVAAKDANTFTINFANSYTPTADDVDRYVCATVKSNIPVWLGTDGNFNQKNANTSGSYENIAAYRLASAINASMVVCDTSVTGQTTFVPWLTANAGGEYGVGQLTVRQPRYSSTTFEVLLGTIGSNYDIFVNNVKRASSAQISATQALFPSRVLISYQNHPEIFDNPTAALQEDSDSVCDVNSADGEEITGIVPFFAESAFSGSQVESLVVVFKTNSVYLLDVKTRAVQKIDSQGLGCVAPYSIAPTRNGIMFANLSGVYRLNRNLTISYVGKLTERYWRNTVNASELSTATGHNYALGQQYKLSVPVDDDTDNSIVLVYDHTREGQEQEFGAWTKHTNHPATGWASLDEDSFFATTSGQVFRIRTANDASDFRDDSDAITATIIPKAMDAGLPGARKACRAVVAHMRLDLTSVTGTTVYASVDNSTTFENAGTIAAARGSQRVTTFTISLPTPKFTFLQLKFVNSVKDEDFVLAGLDLLVAALSVKGITERSELQ